MAALRVMPEPEFFSTSQLRDWLGKGQAVLRPLSQDLLIASKELIVVLGRTESANPHFLGLDSKVRARLVGAHLRRSAEAVEAAHLSLIKTYLTFRHHYIDDARGGANPRSKYREFKFDD